MGGVAGAWNAEYRSGRYAGEPPVAFVGDILGELGRRPDLRAGRGLYVGCGNGRNYIPLAKAGLDVVGLDVSSAGLRQVAEREPQLSGNLVCRDFLEYGGGGRERFGYIIAIQSFQHGDRSRTHGYFRHAAGMLGRGGLLFVRVNCSDTSIARPHRVTEDDGGGFTALYGDGPKRGLHIRFFSEAGLGSAVREAGMRMVRMPRRVTSPRPGRRGGRWSQWEAVAAPEGP